MSDAVKLTCVTCGQMNRVPLAKLADLQSHGALVLGAWLPFAPRACPC